MVLIGILIINGYLELQRTRSQLFNILESEALVVIKGIEKNSGNMIAAISQDRPFWPSPGAAEGSEDTLGIEDLLIERLINIALSLDQEQARKPPDPQSLKKRLGQFRLKDIYFLKAEPKNTDWKELPKPLRTGVPFFQKVLTGKARLAVFRGEGPWRQSISLAVAVARRFDRGIILMILSSDEYVFLSRQIIIQGFLEDFSGKGNIAYLLVEGPQREVIARTGEAFPADSGQEQERKEVRSGDPGLFWIRGKTEEFLEIVRPFTPAGKDQGRIRLGLSLKEVNPILEQAKRNIILMGIVLLGLGMISLFFIFQLQGRHLQKMKEMEEQIRSKEELSAMGQLAAGVAHEIKNPLNAISLVVQRLQKEFHWPNLEEQKEYDRFTRIVRNEISRVNQIIGHFLMMAKPLESTFEEQSVIDILEYVLEVMGEEFRQKGIKVIKEGEQAVPLIPCDRFQLTQAFLNIFNNALEAMPDGGEIRLAVNRVQISGSGVQSGGNTISKLKTRYSELHRDCVEISVADTGKGIPADGLKKIFAHYYTTKERGLGLGLPITRKIIQAHEGTLEVKSAENKGTTVIVRLPLRSSRRENALSPKL